MNVIHFLMFVFVVNGLFLNVNGERKDKCDNVKTSLNVLRKRRHLTFPEGTNMVVSTILIQYLLFLKCEAKSLGI